MRILHIDIETYSSIDLKSSGAYKYIQSDDFEILLVAYAFDDYPIQIVDLAQGEQLPNNFIQALSDPSVEKWAHNAKFERLSFAKAGYSIPINQWHCTMIKAAYCGWPLGLDSVSKAMKLRDKAKLTSGKALIKYFCVPCKPTKANGLRTRNLPEHNLSKWKAFKDYCIKDVEAERAIHKRLAVYTLPVEERSNYLLDQKINDTGILLDLELAQNAIKINEVKTTELNNKIVELTGVDNPNSTAQLKAWLSKAMQKEIKSLAKAEIPKLLKEAGPGTVSDVLNLRSKNSKTSIKKYASMLNCAGLDNRARGLLQFYGANRTGRWAGRLIQVQNLRRNNLKDLSLARDTVASGDYDLLSMLYGNIPDVLSQLIRTAFIAKPKHIFAVADFSAIEARVIAWLAGEEWRLDVFKTHGKIYEASASMMFGIPIEQITKTSEARYKGKVAELALGFGGSVGAMKNMGGESMGLSEIEMKSIVNKWRNANPAIVNFWKETELNAKRAIKTRKQIPDKYGRLLFEYDGDVLTIKLASGRKLFYQQPRFIDGKYGKVIAYMGLNQTTKQWTLIDTYGGKLVENIVQATARDLLAQSLLKLDAANFTLVMHVHDEVICEIPDTGDAYTNNRELDNICDIMGSHVSWAEGLPLGADGYLTKFYMKD